MTAAETPAAVAVTRHLPEGWPVRRHFIAVVLILCSHAGLLAISAMIHSPAWDEVGHLPAGISHLQTSRFDLYRVNPPLVRMMGAVTPFALGTRLDFPGATATSRALERNEFIVGDQWMAYDAWNFIQTLRLARLTCIPFSLLAGYLCYRTARRWYGPQPGLVALTLWCTSPLVIGHGSLMTPDVGAASLGFASVLAFQKWLTSATYRSAALGGILLGLALLCKFTLLILLPLLGLISLVSIITVPQQRWARLGQAGVALVVMVYTINMGYGFEDSFQSLGEFQFVSEFLRGPASESAVYGNRFRESPWASLPVPVPANFLYGVDVQRLDFEGRMSSYLAGVWQSHGWWYYYLYAWLVKEPTGSQILLVMGLFASLRGTEPARSFSMAFVILPAVALFAFVSSQTGFNHHLRYALPAYPFLYTLASATFAESASSSVGRSIAWVALVWTIIASALVFPHSLSYFNELAGGPTNGPRHLHNSNLDWGQDLLLLHRWVQRHPECRPLRIAFSGGFDSSQIPSWGDDVKHGPISHSEADELLSGRQTGTWYAVSVGLMYDPPGTGDRYRVFRERRPDSMIGYSIYLFHF